VDTSVWVDFLRGLKGSKDLSRLLVDQQVICHPWIIIELALGHLGPARRRLLNDIEQLPKLQECPSEEILNFIEKEALYGKGLSFVDIQLLYAAMVEDHFLWTHDKHLHRAASQYAISFIP